MLVVRSFTSPQVGRAIVTDANPPKEVNEEAKERKVKKIVIQVEIKDIPEGVDLIFTTGASNYYTSSGIDPDNCCTCART